MKPLSRQHCIKNIPNIDLHGGAMRHNGRGQAFEPGARVLKRVPKQ